MAGRPEPPGYPPQRRAGRCWQRPEIAGCQTEARRGTVARAAVLSRPWPFRLPFTDEKRCQS
jgi:hypothetical protein